jgi:uncharacterized protein
METPLPVDLGRIAQDLQIRRVQVESVVELLDENNTVPFIARYRRERTGGLSEGLIREIRARLGKARELSSRKQTILKTLELQGHLSEELAAAINSADNPKRLEDLFLPYKPKKKSKGMEARELGLEPLALRIWNRDETLAELNAAASEFLDAEKGLDSPEKVLEGVNAILAESISELAHIRDAMRRVAWRFGKVVSLKNESVPEGKGLEFRDYFSYSEPAVHIPPHRVLAINRGEKEGVLKVKLDVPRAELERTIVGLLPLEDHPHGAFFTGSAHSAIEHYLMPSLEREIKRDLTELAERHAVDVFARNMRSLLLQPPLSGHAVLAIDPGRKGCKAVALNAEGQLLDHASFHLTPHARRSEAKLAIKDLVAKHQIAFVAIGNGPSCRETEEFLTEIIAEGTHFHNNPGVPFPVAASKPAAESAPRADSETSSPGTSGEAAQVAHEGTLAPDPSPETASHEPAASPAPAEANLETPETVDVVPAPAEEAPYDLTSEPSTADGQVTTNEPEASVMAGETEDGVDDFPPILGGSSDAESEPVEPQTAAPHPDTPLDESTNEHVGAHAIDSDGDKATAEVATIVPDEAVASAELPTVPDETPGEAPPSPAEPGAVSETAASPVEAAAPGVKRFTPLTAPPKGPVKPRVEAAPRPAKIKTPPAPPAPHAADALLAAIQYVVVNEAGASAYGSSSLGREELPDIDAELRAAISIGRRLQDPLSELVKVEPHALGVGHNHHDVNPKSVKETLEQVAEHCVNLVGVDVNRAHATLLARVSGLNELLARRIVDYRKEHGPFRTRDQIKQVEGISDEIFAQAAGFLRLREGDAPLDSTRIHPESYELISSLLAESGTSVDALLAPETAADLFAKLDGINIPEKAKAIGLAEPALFELLESLRFSDRDPREELPRPILKRGLLKLDELVAGTELKGTVLNVVDFGAFVDIGLKDSGLVHISQLANRYVKNPHDVVSVGDVVSVWVMGVDKDRKRVSLTMIAPGSVRPRNERTEPAGRGPRPGGSRERGPRPGDEQGGARHGGHGQGERGQQQGSRRRDRPPASQASASSAEGGQPSATPAAPRPGTNRIPGPPLRLQGRSGRGPGRGPGRGGPGGPGRGPGMKGGGRPGGAQEGGSDAPAPPRPKPKPVANPQLSSEERTGNVPLRSFGQLKQLFELRTNEPGDEGAPENDQRTDNSTSQNVPIEPTPQPDTEQAESQQN